MNQSNPNSPNNPYQGDLKQSISHRALTAEISPDSPDSPDRPYERTPGAACQSRVPSLPG